MSGAPADLQRRRALLRAALGFAIIPCCREAWRSGVREVAVDGSWPERGPVGLRSSGHRAWDGLRSWLSTWSGIGLVAASMARQGYDLSLTRYAALGGRATFYVAGREHSPTGASGSAFEPTPFRAVQAAAWETLART